MFNSSLALIKVDKATSSKFARLAQAESKGNAEGETAGIRKA